MLTARDFAVMKDLFFHDRLLMEHIRTLHFPGIHPKTAYNRMNILKHKGYLDNAQVDLPPGQSAPGRDGGRPINYFFLRPKTRAMMAAILERENLHMRHLYASPPAIKQGRDHIYLDENVSPRPLDSERVAHNYAVAGLYAALQPTLVKGAWQLAQALGLAQRAPRLHTLPLERREPRLPSRRRARRVARAAGPEKGDELTFMHLELYLVGGPPGTVVLGDLLQGQRRRVGGRMVGPVGGSSMPGSGDH